MSRRANAFVEGEMRVFIMRVSVRDSECAWVLLRGVLEEWFWMCLALRSVLLFAINLRMRQIG